MEISENLDPVQVNDDIDLLCLMIEDQKKYDKYFIKSGRWDSYSERFLEFLNKNGLRDFRRFRPENEDDPGKVLLSFGAVDLNVPDERATPESLFAAAFTSFTGENAVSIRDLEASRVGNPEGFLVENKFYTLSWLNFYCRYAYVSRFIDLDNTVVVEVGPGSGKQAEMLKKAHPSMTILLFDIPTQLYVCHQYLSKVFEGQDQIVGYSETRNFKNFSDVVAGKINIIPNWKFEIIHHADFDLLWNAASFQEMDPETAARYLSYSSSAKNMYLMHTIKYRSKAIVPGERGVIQEKYIPEHQLVEREWARIAYVTHPWNYFDSFWKKDDKKKSLTRNFMRKLSALKSTK